MSLESAPTPTSVLVSHAEWLRTILLARLHDHAVTDDVMQEVSVAAVRHRGAFENVEEVKAWLYRVSIRQANLIHRRERRQRDRLAVYAENHPGLLSVSYLDALCRDESHDLVVQTLRRLPPIDRQVLALKYRNGWSCAEIAKELAVSESSIQSRLLRARRRLRSLLIQHESFE